MTVQYIQYKGINFPPGYNSVQSLHFAENNFKVRDDDIFNVTYPKSGVGGEGFNHDHQKVELKTGFPKKIGFKVVSKKPGKNKGNAIATTALPGTVWMTEILSLILNRGDATWNRSILNSLRAPWFSTRLGLETAQNCPSPRLLTCHLPIQIFPKAFFSSKAKVVYTYRDPRDIVVSYYYFTKMCNTYEDPRSFNRFLESFLSGEVPHGSWFDHVKGWVELEGRGNVFFISYEELKQKLWVSVEHLCRFLGKELDDAAIASVVENASFEAMRRNRMCNSTMLPKELMDQEKGTFLRKGICGDWKNHFTVAQSEYFDRVYQEKMQGLKRIFPWEETGLVKHS